MPSFTPSAGMTTGCRAFLGDLVLHAAAADIDDDASFQNRAKYDAIRE